MSYKAKYKVICHVCDYKDEFAFMHEVKYAQRTHQHIDTEVKRIG